MEATDITPRLVVDLYRKHGLKPRAHSVVPAEGACCGMGVLAVELKVAGTRDAYKSYTKVAATTEAQRINEGLCRHFGPEFVANFESGFDNGWLGNSTDFIRSLCAISKSYNLGFEAGKLARGELG
jgi:hypothetical protein